MNVSMWPKPQPQNSLQHIAVELLLPVAQELANHLSAQALALQQEVGYSHWCVRHKATLNEVLDALLRLPGGWDKRQAQPWQPRPFQACSPPPWALKAPQLALGTPGSWHHVLSHPQPAM